jgi:hypothetical protein
MKRPAAKPAKGPRSLISEADREHALDEALAECSPASDPAAMIGPGRREVLDQEDDA